MEYLIGLGIKGESHGACCGPGRWLGGGPSLESINPATGTRLGGVRAASAEDCEAVVAEAVAAFRAWREVPAPERGQCVRAIGEELRARKDLLGTLVAAECGKIKAEGDGEVQEMIDIADFAVGQSRMLYGKSMHSERPRHRMYEQWHPLGPVAVITAFNFPVAVWAWNAFIAAVAGDTVIWKPSEKTPLCAVAVQHICNRVMERLGHPGVFGLAIPAERALAEALVDDPRLPLVSFTGSSGVGRRVGERVARRFGRSLLECSGNNAVIVDGKADLDLATRAIVFGAIGTAAQRCTSTRRVIVHRSRLAELSGRLVSAYAEVRIGDPMDAGVLMGPLIDRGAVEAFLQAVARVRELGGEILCGGRTIERPGHFVEPTLARSENQWDVVQRETFGPLLHLIPFDTLEEAIELNNGVPQGLSSALFCNDLARAERFLSAAGSDCGIANVNIGTSGAEIGGAFGGEKETGGGREAGSDAWKAYMRRQTTTVNWGGELPLAQGIRFELGAPRAE